MKKQEIEFIKIFKEEKSYERLLQVYEYLLNEIKINQMEDQDEDKRESNK